MSTLFAAALREHFRTHGGTRDRFGMSSLRYHMEKTGCRGWLVPDGARAVPRTAWTFDGTDCGQTPVEVIKLDADVDCACGKYQAQRIQVEGSFSDLLTQLLDIDVPSEVQF